MALAPDKPDWRWHAVTALLECAAVMLHQLDPLTQSVYKFRRQYRDRFIVTAADYAAAHELWHQRPYQRGILEGLILGGASDDVIQEEMEIGTEDIAAYVAMFFDVRGRKRLDICNMVFQGAPHKGYHQNDRLGTMHRLGWFGGYKLLQALTTSGVNSDDTQRLCSAVCRDIMRRQLPEIGLSVGSQAQFAPEYLKLSTEWDANSAQDTRNDLQEAVFKIFSQQTLEIADPSDERNLTLPAEELPYVEATEVPNA
jgi:hypothetical protein